EEARTNLAAVESADDRRIKLQKEVASLAATYEAAARKLSAKRKESARALAMEKTRVEIRVQPAEWSDRGADSVAFLIAPNVGEELKPLDKIASGGELSRVALALKTCTSASGTTRKKDVPRTLVFDEKHSEHGRTIASIEELAPDARTREIGRMLSGERITQEALRHAEQLLKMAAK